MDGSIMVAQASMKLINLLWDVKRTKEHNVLVAGEVELFVTSLLDNLQRIEKMLPKHSSSWALESLEAAVNNASTEVENCLKKGLIKSLWDAKDTQLKLAGLRQNLVDAFHLYLFISTLKVSLEGAENMQNFESTMLKLSALSAAQSDAASTEIKNLLKPLLAGMQKQDERLQTIVNLVKNDDGDSSEETQKFIADVMRNLESLPDKPDTSSRGDADGEFYDPISFDLMCDPVKCRDGLTYDRWTIIEYNLKCKVPKQIVCDDVSLRGRLFKRFPGEGLEEKCRSLRKMYRFKALDLAKKGHHGEASTMLTHVLQWDESDTECLQMLQLMEDKLKSQREQNEMTSGNSKTHLRPEASPPPQQTSIKVVQPSTVHIKRSDPPSIQHMQRASTVSSVEPNSTYMQPSLLHSTHHTMEPETKHMEVSASLPEISSQAAVQMERLIQAGVGNRNDLEQQIQLPPQTSKVDKFIRDHPICLGMCTILLCPCVVFPVCCYKLCSECISGFMVGFSDAIEKQKLRT